VQIARQALRYCGIDLEAPSTFTTGGGYQEREGFFHGCIMLGIARFARQNDKIHFTGSISLGGQVLSKNNSFWL
jgi:hypothetical protein